MIYVYSTDFLSGQMHNVKKILTAIDSYKVHYSVQLYFI